METGLQNPAFRKSIMRRAVTLLNNIALFLFWGSAAAEHWLGPKYPWLRHLCNLFMLAFGITIFLGNWNRQARRPMTVRENTALHIFLAIFIGIAIAYNLGHWYLVILAPACAYFALTSFFLVKQAHQTEETQSTLLQQPR
jgi:hypothetical protein